MWMWPLDRAMGVTAAHRAPERMVDGMCTRVWAWMTDKCKRRMNGREGYITTEITQSKKEKRRRRPRKRREASGMWEELGVPVLGREVLSPWDIGPSDSVYFSPPKQVVASSELNFWTHSLQIHCNGSGSKTETLHIYITKILTKHINDLNFFLNQNLYIYIYIFL